MSQRELKGFLYKPALLLDTVAREETVKLHVQLSNREPLFTGRARKTSNLSESVVSGKTCFD